MNNMNTARTQSFQLYVCSLLAALACFGQNQPKDTRQEEKSAPAVQAQRNEPHAKDMVKNDVDLTKRVSELIGHSIRNSAGEELGNISDVVVDLKEGCIAYAIVSFASFLGPDNKLFALPWKSLQLQADSADFVLDIAEGKLLQAPGFDRHKWPETGNRSWGAQLHQFYDQTPYWNEPKIDSP